VDSSNVLCGGDGENEEEIVPTYFGNPIVGDIWQKRYLQRGMSYSSF
jgi:hypothetical protein